MSSRTTARSTGLSRKARQLSRESTASNTSIWLMLVAALAVGRRANVIGLGRRQQAAGRFRQRRRVRGRQHAVLAVHRIKVRRRPVHVKLENVRPIVMAGEVVAQLRQDAELEIALGI